MYQNNDNCQNDYKIINGNSLELTVGECESEIRADVTVSELDSVRLWGRIVNCNGDSVPNALVKLVKVVCGCNGNEYIGIAHTMTDCEGFYQFELCSCPKDTCFKIIVSKAAYGPERIIDSSNGGACNPCDNSNGYPFDPCAEYEPFVTPAANCGCSSPKNSNDCNCKKGW